MAELKLLDKQTNEPGNEVIGPEDKRIPPTECMLKGYHTPEELKLMTFGAMNKMQQDKRRRRKTVMKVVSTAAVLLVGVMLTPLSGCAKNAVEGAYNAVQQWFDNTEHMGYTRYDHGCEISLIETRMTNEFFCITLNEDYSTYLNEYRQELHEAYAEVVMDDADSEMVTDDFGEEYYLMQDVTKKISGAIIDSEGNRLLFSDENVSYYENVGGVVTDEGYENLLTSDYRIFLPGLRDFIKPNGKYTFNLRIIISDAWYGDYITTLTFNDIPLNKFDAVLSAKDYEVEYSYTLGNVRYDFQKMVVGATESNLYVDVTPIGSLADRMAKRQAENADEMDIFETYGFEVYQLSPEMGENPVDFLNEHYDHFGRLRSQYGLVAFDSMAKYVIDGRYVIILTYDGQIDSETNVYDPKKVIDTGKNEFLLYNFSYYYGEWDYTGDPARGEEYKQWAGEERYGESRAMTLPDKSRPSRVIGALESQRVSFDTPALRKKGYIDKIFTAGTLSFKARFYAETTENRPYDIEILSIHDGDELIYTSKEGRLKDTIRIGGVVFQGIADDEVIVYFYGDIEEDEMIPSHFYRTVKRGYDIHDVETIELDTFGYVVEDDNGTTYYNYYNSNNYDAKRFQTELKEDNAASLHFAKHNTFSIKG